MADAVADNAAPSVPERRVIVEGFEERGGILKLKQQKEEEKLRKQQEEKVGYAPWDQKKAWFNEPGKSEQA